MQSELPCMKEIEEGRKLDPDYDTELLRFTVVTADWRHVCSARFGHGRPCSWSNSTKWTGDSYRYDIFSKPKGHGLYARMALRWWNGSGEGWLVTNDLSRRGETCLLSMISELGNEARRWDACHLLWQTAHKTALAAARSESAVYRRAFVEGRLKKRKRRGASAYMVTIVQE